MFLLVYISGLGVSGPFDFPVICRCLKVKEEHITLELCLPEPVLTS
jgi:hypothetical protein